MALQRTNGNSSAALREQPALVIHVKDLIYTCIPKCEINSSSTSEHTWILGGWTWIKRQTLIPSGSISKEGLCGDSSILLLIFQAIKDGVLKNTGTTNCKENHLAHSNFLAGAGASLQVTQKSFWAHINITPVSGNVPPNELPAFLASSLQKS